MKAIFHAVFLILLVASASTRVAAQWTQTNFPSGWTVWCLGFSDSNLFAGAESRLFHSTDNGVNWTLSLTTTGAVLTFGSSGTNLFAGTQLEGVFLSTNNGTSWTPVNTGLGSGSVYSLAFSSTSLFAATHYGRVCRSTNNGTNWMQVNSGLPYTIVSELFVAGVGLFAGTSNGVFLSTNNGESWAPADSGLLPNNVVRSFAALGTNLFAGTDHGGIFLSTNDGTTWEARNSGLTDTRIRSLFVADGALFAGGYGGVSVSIDTGTSWMAVNLGLTNTDVSILAVFGAYLFAGNYYGSLWRRPLSEMTTSVEVISTNVPLQLNLCQNYPNPFNPITTISFSLPSSSFVSLKVFDALGNEVQAIVSETLPGGLHTRQWDGSSFSSGVYFCRLQAGLLTAKTKLILLR